MKTKLSKQQKEYSNYMYETFKTEFSERSEDLLQLLKPLFEMKIKEYCVDVQSEIIEKTFIIADAKKAGNLKIAIDLPSLPVDIESYSPSDACARWVDYSLDKIILEYTDLAHKNTDINIKKAWSNKLREIADKIDHTNK